MASIICFQETQKGEFDIKLIKQFAPKKYDNFAYVPSQGASSGCLLCGLVVNSWAISFSKIFLVWSFNSLRKQPWILSLWLTFMVHVRALQGKISLHGFLTMILRTTILGLSLATSISTYIPTVQTDQVLILAA